MTSNSEQTMEEIVASYDVTDEILRDACKASRVKMIGKFGDLGFRILGLLFAAAGIAAFVIDPGRGAASNAFLIFGGLFLFAIPSLQWRISYSRSKRHFDRSGTTWLKCAFGGEKVLCETPNSRSEFTYKHMTLVIRQKIFLLMFTHSTFLFVPGNLLSEAQMETILNRFRSAGVKVRA